MPEENTRPTVKVGTDSAEPPSREQIDVVFATLLKTVESGTEGHLSEAVAQIIATQWDTARELEKQNIFSTDAVEVEKIAEEWL